MFLQRSSEFRKKFNALPKKMQEKIAVRLEIFTSDEFSSILNNHELHGEYTGCRSINITGDIRIIYRKLDSDNYFLITFGTHHQLYE